jgi:putative ABC transport system permease protein
MVLWWECFRLAIRELLRHRGRSLLTSLGVVIGVAAVIGVVSLVQGANSQIQGQISRLGTNMILVRAGATTRGGVSAGAGTAGTLTNDDARAMTSDCPSIVMSAPVQREVAQAITRLGNWQAAVTGSTAEYVPIRAWDVISGRTLTPVDDRAAAKVCLIGLTTARALFGQLDPVGQTVRIKGVPLRIVGLLEEKGENPLGQDEDDTIVVPLSTMQRKIIGPTHSHIVAIIASAVTESAVDDAVVESRALLRKRHKLGPLDADDFTVDSLKQASDTARQAGAVMTIVAFVAAGISLLVGGIGIMNIMLVAVTERTREIGIRLAIGATRKAIVVQFLIETVALTGAGGLMGIGLGFGFAQLMSNITGWPSLISTRLVMLAVGFSVAVGMIFGIWPARRAARLNPVESLRHD